MQYFKRLVLQTRKTQSLFGKGLNYRQIVIQAHIDLITGWKLGKGPCGPSCKKTDVGKDTRSSRDSYETSNSDIYYFGNWSTETGPPRALVSLDVNAEIKQNIEEHVMAVSEIGEWEQEHMKTKVVLKPVGEKEDVV